MGKKWNRKSKKKPKIRLPTLRIPEIKVPRPRLPKVRAFWNKGKRFEIRIGKKTGGGKGSFFKSSRKLKKGKPKKEKPGIELPKFGMPKTPKIKLPRFRLPKPRRESFELKIRDAEEKRRKQAAPIIDDLQKKGFGPDDIERSLLQKGFEPKIFKSMLSRIRREELQRKKLEEHEKAKRVSLEKKLKPIEFRQLKEEERAILSARDIKQFDLRTASERIEKEKTGVEGLDKLFTQGIPEGASVLIEGGPGSGKTILCLQLAYNACKKGKSALYMSFEEPEMRLISHMRNFGWDPEKHIKNNQLLIKRYSAIDISRSIEALLSAAKKELLIEIRPVFFPSGFKPDIVLIDSLTSIASAFSGESSRFRVYMEQLFKYLETENITSFLVRETPTPSHIGKSIARREEAVSFLSDGIIALYNVIMSSGERTGGIEILKMRGEKFKRKIVQMEITSRGIAVYPDERIDITNVIT